MKWFVCNALGAVSWLAGISLAKGTGVPEGAITAVGGHQMLAAASFGLVGIVLITWSNLRSAA